MLKILTVYLIILRSSAKTVLVECSSNSKPSPSYSSFTSESYSSGFGFYSSNSKPSPSYSSFTSESYSSGFGFCSSNSKPSLSYSSFTSESYSSGFGFCSSNSKPSPSYIGSTSESYSSGFEYSLSSIPIPSPSYCEFGKCLSKAKPSPTSSYSASSSSSSSSNVPCKPNKCNCGFIRKPRSCLELLHRGYNTSGVYNIAPCDQRPCDEVEVYCDMETDGGGWTVFQQRGKDTKMDFNRNFREYAYGFGNAQTDYWLGNEYIHCLTSQTYTQMIVHMTDWCNNTLKEYYSCFFVSDWNSRYELRLKNLTGNSSTDSLMPHSTAKFSTHDLDTFNKRAHQFKGGWWHSAPYSNLNGIYRSREDSKFCCQQKNTLVQKQSMQSCKSDGIFWRKWHGMTYSLKKTTMMLRGRDPQDHAAGVKCYGIDTGFCQTPSLISEAIWIMDLMKIF